MMRARKVTNALFGLCLICAAVTAQTESTISDFGNDRDRQDVSLKLAQKTVGEPKTDNHNGVGRKTTTPPVSDQRRTELMKFVNAHHPELQPLLKSLQENRPNYYESALQTLDRHVSKLQKLQQRSPERYEKSLQQWIAKSKIKLLSAQLAIKKTADEKILIKEKLKQLFEKQHDMRVEGLVEDITQTKRRLEKYETQLAELNANRDNVVKRNLDAAIFKAERIGAAQQKAANEKASKPNRKSDQNVPRKIDTAKPSVDKNQTLKRDADKTDPKNK